MKTTFAFGDDDFWAEQIRTMIGSGTFDPVYKQIEETSASIRVLYPDIIGSLQVALKMPNPIAEQTKQISQIFRANYAHLAMPEPTRQALVGIGKTSELVRTAQSISEAAKVPYAELTQSIYKAMTPTLDMANVLRPQVIGLQESISKAIGPEIRGIDIAMNNVQPYWSKQLVEATAILNEYYSQPARDLFENVREQLSFLDGFDFDVEFESVDEAVDFVVTHPEVEHKAAEDLSDDPELSLRVFEAITGYHLGYFKLLPADERRGFIAATMQVVVLTVGSLVHNGPGIWDLVVFVLAALPYYFSAAGLDRQVEQSRANVMGELLERNPELRELED